jgi:hypothetical protein
MSEWVISNTLSPDEIDTAYMPNTAFQPWKTLKGSWRVWTRTSMRA